MTKRKKILGAALLFGVLTLAVGISTNWFAERPTDLGVRDGRLGACPDSPNCVSSQAAREDQRMESIPFTGDAANAREQLRKTILDMPRAKIVTETDLYMHIEFTTALMRFVDDAEFLIDAERKQIHFCSASRIGYSDFGANRSRMAAVRAGFEATSAARQGLAWV